MGRQQKRVIELLEEIRDAVVDEENAKSDDSASSGGGTYHCGVNDCSRTVDTEDATCWQH